MRSSSFLVLLFFSSGLGEIIQDQEYCQVPYTLGIYRSQGPPNFAISDFEEAKAQCNAEDSCIGVEEYNNLRRLIYAGIEAFTIATQQAVLQGITSLVKCGSVPVTPRETTSFIGGAGQNYDLVFLGSSYSSVEISFYFNSTKGHHDLRRNNYEDCVQSEGVCLHWMTLIYSNSSTVVIKCFDPVNLLVVWGSTNYTLATIESAETHSSDDLFKTAEVDIGNGLAVLYEDTFNGVSLPDGLVIAVSSTEGTVVLLIINREFSLTLHKKFSINCFGSPAIMLLNRHLSTVSFYCREESITQSIPELNAVMELHHTLVPTLLLKNILSATPLPPSRDDQYQSCLVIDMLQLQNCSFHYQSSTTEKVTGEFLESIYYPVVMQLVRTEYRILLARDAVLEPPPLSSGREIYERLVKTEEGRALIASRKDQLIRKQSEKIRLTHSKEIINGCRKLSHFVANNFWIPFDLIKDSLLYNDTTLADTSVLSGVLWDWFNSSFIHPVSNLPDESTDDSMHLSDMSAYMRGLTTFQKDGGLAKVSFASWFSVDELMESAAIRSFIIEPVDEAHLDSTFTTAAATSKPPFFAFNIDGNIRFG